MLKKGTTLNSILTGSCPKCQEESMYVVKNPYLLKTLYKMNKTCSHCHTRYEIEPSFFYGAMYVSYGVSIAFGVAFFITSYYILQTSVKVAMISLIVGIIALMPVIARLSRNIYINMFIHFDKNWKQNS
jgi:VIT1/CCC1 family predicted Fe2+/Mn2+ transporter